MNNNFLASNSEYMAKIEKLHNRHQAKLLDELEKIPIENITQITEIVKKHLSFYTNDIKEQVIVRIYEDIQKR